MAHRIWLITGISSGFGRHLTEQLLDRGDYIVGTVRNPQSVVDLDENARHAAADPGAARAQETRRRQLAVHLLDVRPQRAQPLDEVAITSLDGLQRRDPALPFPQRAPPQSAPSRNADRGCPASGRAASWDR